MNTNVVKIPANYFRGMEAVGGHIFLDDKGLSFKPHMLNIQKEELRIEFSDMRAVERRKTYGLIPNGIVVYTKDDKQHKFVVHRAKKVAEDIRSKIPSL